MRVALTPDGRRLGEDSLSQPISRPVPLTPLTRTVDCRRRNSGGIRCAGRSHTFANVRARDHSGPGETQARTLRLPSRRHMSCSPGTCRAVDVVQSTGTSNMQRERGTMRAGPKEHSVVAIYDSHAGAEAAIITLQHAGLDMKHLSIVGKDLQTEEHALSFYTSSDRMKYWAGRGVFWGSICGMLFGDALFLIPAIGPLVAMGPLAGWIAGALEGAVVGGAAGGLAAALASIGIPKDSVVKYEL